MQKTDPLIRTKLRQPFTRPELVPRPRLQEQVMQGLHGPLTLITAPAGFGKTTLLISCIAGLGLHVAWLSLDKNDNQPGRFLKYLASALQEADSSIGKEAIQLMTGMQHTPPETVLISLINDMDATDREIILVLDDYQFISNQTLHEEVTFLLDHCPKTFHLVIASRSDPPLPLNRLRARSYMVELRAADLSFTESETAQFLNDIMGLHLDARSVAMLTERTEGWVAGLQMAALSMWGRQDVDKFILTFAGTNRFIMEFMLEEVLHHEAEDVQNFLLQTAMLNRLTAPLCNAVTGIPGGQQMLESLESRNLFIVPLDDERCWYRYHHLFADLLQARLHQSKPDLVAQLLSRAAEWCEKESLITEAVDYSLAAQDYEHAADLIAKYWHLTINTGEVENVWSWLGALPEGTIRNSAPLSVAYCWMLWLRGQVNAIETHLLDAEQDMDTWVKSRGDKWNNEIYAQLPAQLSVLRSFVARYQNNFKTAIELAENALTLVPENLPPQENAQLRTLIYIALATACDGAGELEKVVNAYIETIRLSRLFANITGVTGITYRLSGILRMLGRLRAADAACQNALDYIEVQGIAHLPAIGIGILHIAMSEILVEQNDLDAAEIHFLRGIELGKWGGRLDAVRNGANVLVRLKQAQHDLNGALAAIQEAELALGTQPSPLAKAELLALKARIMLQQQSLSAAGGCVEEALRLSGQDRGLTGELVTLASLRLRIAQGNLEEAILQLSRSIAAAEETGRLGTAIEMSILRSLAWMQAKKEQQGDLERALALAEPEGYARIFLDEGRPMQLLLTQWLSRSSGSALRNYAAHLLVQFKTETQKAITAQGKYPPGSNSSTSPEQALIEPLSQRELEVLQLIATGKTNQEIARLLIVSPGTIKAHTASIYRKLGVSNRTEAVAQARLFGILF